MIYLTMTFLGLLSDSLSYVDIAITPQVYRTVEGSCVTIGCTVTSQTLVQIKNPQMIWMKNSIWDNTLKEFNGTVVYNSTDEQAVDDEFKNRTSMAKGNNRNVCTLTINDLKKGDSGVFSLRYLWHPTGGTLQKYMSKTNMTLTVQENPCKLSVEDPGAVMEGTLVKLNCSTSASCGFSPQWHSSDHILHRTNEHGMTTQLTLNVTWEKDGQTLSCSIPQNNDHCLVRNVTLTVMYSPKETKAESNPNYVKEGDNIVLKCTSRGNPNPTYTWFVKGKNVSTNSTLVLNHVKPEDSGEAYCKAHNKYEEQTSNILQIDVQYAPKEARIILSATIEEIEAGHNLTLKCQASRGNPSSADFSWYKDDKNVGIYKAENFFAHVQPEDAGKYVCEASNSVGSVKSSPVHIHVKYGPRNTEVQVTCSGYLACLENQVKLGDQLSLKCKTDAEPSVLSYVWYKRIGESFVVLRGEDSDLHKNVEVSDTGDYMCSAANSIGVQNSSVVHITVRYAPREPVLEMKSLVTEFDTLVITCSVESFPLSKLILQKKPSAALPGVLVSSVLAHMAENMYSEIIEGSNHLRVSINVSFRDTGRYVCHAVNTEGQAFTEKELTVMYSPKNTAVVMNPERAPKEKENLELICTAQSFPDVSNMTWIKLLRDKTMTVGYGPSLRFKSLTEKDSGLYCCRAKNEVGEQTSKPIDIRVQYGPKDTRITHNMTGKDLRYRDTAVELSCHTNSYPTTVTYRWYRRIEANMEKFVTDRQNLTVPPEESGTYFCVASNLISSSLSGTIELPSRRGVLHLVIYIGASLAALCLLVVLYGFLSRRKQKKKRTRPHSERGSLCRHPCLGFLSARTGTRESLVMEGMGESQRSREDLGAGLTFPHAQDHVGPQQSAAILSTSSENVHTVYSAVKNCGTAQRSPNSALKAKDEDTVTQTVCYASLHFPGSKNDSDSKAMDCIYAKVSKPQTTENGANDYENVKGLDVKKTRDTDSETSDDDQDINYSVVAIKPKGKSKDQSQYPDVSSSSDEEVYGPQYSDIKM